jgi:hypothetical protein
MSKELVPTAAQRGSLGGESRASKLSAEERRAIARKGAESRWGADLPRATHDGPLPIGDAVLMAAVLPNGKRLIVQGTMLMAIGRSRTPKAGTGGSVNVDGLPFFLSAEVLKPFITDDLRLSTTPIFFRLKGGQRAVGYDALLLPLVCKVYQDLRDSLLKKLTKGDKKEAAEAKTIYARYEHIIARCDSLAHGFGQRGIIALVDDATGYQADLARDEITKILEKYIAPKLMPWTRKFPHDFFREAYRLLGWEYRLGQVKHPSYMGHFINKYVYGLLPPGVLEKLKEKSPKNEGGNRSNKLWQWLTEHTGEPHLDKILASDVTIMQLSDSKEHFEHNFARIYGKQQMLPITVDKKLLTSGEA